MNNIYSKVKANVDLLRVFKSLMRPRRSSEYYRARCPLCKGSGLPFTMSIKKQIFYCFECHTGGDVITLVSKVSDLSQKDAAKYLAAKYNIKDEDLKGES